MMLLSEEESRDKTFFSVKNFINKSPQDQLNWLREKDQEHLWKDIPEFVLVTGNQHDICGDHEIILQEGKQFWCDCSFT